MEINSCKHNYRICRECQEEWRKDRSRIAELELLLADSERRQREWKKSADELHDLRVMLEQQLAAAQNQIVELTEMVRIAREAVEKAPHSSGCPMADPFNEMYDDHHPCQPGCWVYDTLIALLKGE